MRHFVSVRTLSLVILVVTIVSAYFLIGTENQQAQERREPAQPSYKGKFQKYAISDEITANIRSGATDLVRVRFKTLAEKESVGRFGKVVQDMGASAIISTTKSREMTRAGLEFAKLETTVNLPGAKFDPVANPAAGSISTEAAFEGSEGYFIVQFGAATTDELLDSLRDAGLEVLQYVPHQAFFVFGNAEAVNKVTGHSRVRWVGQYLPEQKSSPELNDFVRGVESETASFDIAYFARADLSHAAHDFRASLRGRIISESRLPSNFFNVLRVEMPVSELSKALELPHVFRIDPYIKPTPEDERAAQIVAGNYSSVTVLNAPGYDPLTQFGADGTGVTVSVSDDGISIPGNGGFYITSNNTVDGPLRGATAGAAGGHGHINASIIAGATPFGILDPTKYNYGLGVAPKANIINIPFLKSGNTTTDAQAVDDTLNTLGPNGERGTISNNSWGAGTNNNSYDSFAATYDGLVRDGSFAPTIDQFSIIFSAGNCGQSPNNAACSGQSGLTRPKVAKNVLSVGASENLRPEFQPTSANNLDDVAAFSSRGLAADGRIKPEILAPGTAISGSRAGSCSSVSSCFDPNHAWSSGTSHAAPQAAGVAALFTQYWKDRNAGEFPRPSLVKAAIIGSGQEMGGVGGSNPIPNGDEGWGRINMQMMMNTGVPMKYVNETHEFFSPGESVVYSGTVGDATKPFRVTLVWTDPPGVGNPALVNNLDLTVNVNGTIYRGNVFSNGQSNTGGTHSTVDNVENVFLPAGLAAGTPMTITVNATALNGDGILGNGDLTDQHFSLVAYNFAEPTVTAAAPFDFTGDGRTDLAVYRPAPGEWWISAIENGSGGVAQFGTATDIIIPAEYTGDGKADIAVWRPSTGEWFVLRSEDSSYFAFPFGTNGDIPLSGDFDEDGKSDAIIFRPSTGVWYIAKSGGGIDIVQFGLPGDLPAVGDYDGDGKADIAIYRPSSGQWWINQSTDGVIVHAFGTSTDMIVPGDYTGDGKTDVAFWRPSTGEWFILRSEDFSFFSFPFGTTGDIPVPGDYDGDGFIDPAVFRPADSVWYILRSTAGTFIAQFGTTGDQPVPSAYVR